MKLHQLAVSEHERAPRPEPLANDAVLAHLESGAQLNVLVATPGMEPLALFRDELDSNHHIIVLTPRTAQEEPVGYAVLARPSSRSRWQVVDVELNPALRGKGYITNLYQALVSGGYRLQSGAVLSPEAERVWRSLGRAGLAKVLDTQTDELLPFSDAPVGDGDQLQGKSPRFYWVAEERRLNIYSQQGKLTEQQERDYLAGAKPDRAAVHLFGVHVWCIKAEE